MEISEKYRSSIFSIVFKKDDFNVKHLGTGFFIGLGGLFYTCGHTFRKIENIPDLNVLNDLFIAFPQKEAELFRIKSLYHISFEIYEQKGPEYKDSAVGVVDFENTEFLVFNRKRPANGEILHTIGIYNDNENKLLKLNGNRADLDLLKLSETELKVFSQEPLISDYKPDYRIPPEKVNPRRFYNNCVGMKGTLIKGESGCPVIDNLGLVRGTFIASFEENDSSVMLLSKYCTKVIRHRTYYYYDTCQDLKLR